MIELNLQPPFSEGELVQSSNLLIMYVFSPSSGDQLPSRNCPAAHLIHLVNVTKTLQSLRKHKGQLKPCARNRDE